MKFTRCFFLSACAALIASVAQAQDNWARNFRIGLLLGVNIDADFKSGGNFTLSGNPGNPAQPGTNHEYDDGYVRVDDTGNAGGLTGHWGYSSASQYDSYSKTLTFHSSKSADIADVSSSGLDDSPYIGLEAAYGGTFRQYQRMRVGWEAAFGYLPIDIKDSRTTSGTFTRTVHQFPTGDIIPPIAPYQGGSSGAGEPLISDTGTSLADDVATGTITGSNELDVDLFTLRFGPTFYWQLHPRWAVSASAGGVVGLVSGDYKFNAMAVLPTGTTHDSGKIGETEFTYGGYINALALFRVEEHADIFAGVQFMPMSDVKFRESGREAKLNLGGGLYFTAGINWPF